MYNQQTFAGVAEQVDARDLKSREGNLVPVRFRPPAPIETIVFASLTMVSY